MNGKAYIETSFLNRALDIGISGQQILEALACCQLRPAVCTTIIYELARTFAECPDRGKKLFSLLHDIEGATTFLQPVREMLKQEVIKLRTGALPLLFVDHLNHVAFRQEIARLANGNSHEAEAFIRKRDRHYGEVQPLQNKHYIREVRRQRGGNSALKTFADVYSDAEQEFPTQVRSILRPHMRVNCLEAKELANRLAEFPTLHSCVRVNCRIAFHFIVHDTPPGDDKWDDYRHVVEAAYCDAFATGERKTRAISDINPVLKILRFEELLALRR